MNSRSYVRRRSPGVLMRVLAIVLAVLLTTALIIQRSDSAFTSATEYGGNVVGAGTVTLTDDDAGNSPFAIENMAPGDTVTRCVTVTYEGTIDPKNYVHMYAEYADTSAAATDGAQYLDFSVKVGDEGATCDSIGTPTGTWPTSGASTLAGFVTAFPAYTQSLDTGWSPTDTTDRARPVQLTVSLPGDAPNDAQGKSAKPVFWWEIRTS